MYKLNELKKNKKDWLVNHIYNTQVCSFCEMFDESGEFENDKTVPYMGWFWRTTDFIGKSITIGKSFRYVGVMENNKWGYASRSMTEAEVDKFVEYLDKAIEANSEGGVLSEIEENTKAILVELNNWIQSLGDTGEWIKW